MIDSNLDDYTNHHNDDRHSITPSGHFGASAENIVVIEDFMTQEELELLNEFIRKNTSWDQTESHYNEDGTVIYDSNYWEDRVATATTLDKVDPRISQTITVMQLRLKERVDAFFSVDAKATSPAIVRWLPGQLQMPHADKELHEGDHRGKPNDFPYYDIAGLFYINDDYVGGELYFPNQEIQFKPKAGAAYFFPGDMNYIHGVTPIESGIRFTVPFFWTVLEHKIMEAK
jgi:predicted 2-oxoglutarate/Fe(II)-dependent dioxygenase YbiX